MRAAGEQTRLRILTLLRNGELSVGELSVALGQSQPRLSHHLKTLAGAGLVDRLPEGAWVFYRWASDTGARTFLDDVFRHLGDDSDVGRDAEQLKRIRRERARTAEAYFSNVATDWDKIRSLHYPEERIEAALLDAAGPNRFAQLVDLGTGTGRMLTLFSARVDAAEGVDFSHQMLTVARTNLEREGVRNASVRHGDVAATPYPDDFADLVVIHQVLHYVDDPERVIEEASRILAPGGRMLLVDFAPHDLEFLRTEHGHRRLGLRHDALAGWTAAYGVSLDAPKRFDPPKDKRGAGLSVLLWTARKPMKAKEKAA